MISLTPLEIDALVLSLRVGVWSLVICLPTGLLIALILARWKFPGKWLLDGIVHLPLGPAAGGDRLWLCWCCSDGSGAIGGWLYENFGITLAFTWRGAAIASAVVALPLVVRAIRLSLEGVDGPGLEAAARTLGASAAEASFATSHPAAAASPASSAWHASSPSPAASANSAPPSPSSRISPARPKPCRWPSSLKPKCPATPPRRSGWR